MSTANLHTRNRAAVCGAAGRRVPIGSELYRDYVIEPSFQGDRAWEFQHRNYSGPPDSRCGTVHTPEAARAAIDERIDEGFDDDAPPAGYVVRLGGAA